MLLVLRIITEVAVEFKRTVCGSGFALRLLWNSVASLSASAFNLASALSFLYGDEESWWLLIYCAWSGRLEEVLNTREIVTVVGLSCGPVILFW